MSDKKPNLSAAYGLSSPEDNQRLYADWAESYDEDFAGQHDYRLHVHTARAFVEAGGQGPVLDAGAGTGLCGEVLSHLGVGPIDATDISGEMLQVAESKDVYRDLFQADLLEGLPVRSGAYAGVVSSGTFTHGHLGPEAFEELLRVTRPGGQIVVSINAQHFEALGFDAALDSLAAQIGDLQLAQVRIYGPGATDTHKDDLAVIAQFRKR